MKFRQKVMGWRDPSDRAVFTSRRTVGRGPRGPEGNATMSWTSASKTRQKPMRLRQKVDPSDLQPPLPATATTLEGVEFDPRKEIGMSRTRSESAIEFGNLERLSVAMIHGLKWTILPRCQNKSFSHARNLLITLLSSIGWSCITVTRPPEDELSHILTFKGHLNGGKEWYPRHCPRF